MTETRKPNGEILLHHRCTTCWDSRGGRAEGRRPYAKKRGRYYYVCHLDDSHHWSHDESKILIMHRHAELERLFADSMPNRMTAIEATMQAMQEQAAEMRRKLEELVELIAAAKKQQKTVR